MDLNKRNLYRLPWSMNDNPIGWVEITDICNIHCKGCYRQKLEGHKSLEMVKDEIKFLQKWRNCDNISISGGEPILHPKIIEIVRFITERGMKPILLTNGMALTKEMLIELKKAKLAGLVLHIDMWQNRPGWEEKNEDELCALREQIADMVYEVGGIPCSFNITVYKENFSYIPNLVRWSIKNAKKVQGFIFIVYRAVLLQLDRKYLIDGQKLKLDESSLGYVTTKDPPEDIGIKSTDVYRLIKKHFPEYEPSGYLGGSKLHDSFKWLIGFMLCGNNEVFGSLGKKTIELLQTIHHLFYGTYFVYIRDKSPGKKIFLLSLVDPLIRRTLGRFLCNPLNLFRPLQGVGIGIIQAPDVLSHGEVDMCDSCPDMAVFRGRLVNSCRLDEYRKFGTTMTPLR